MLKKSVGLAYSILTATLLLPGQTALAHEANNNLHEQLSAFEQKLEDAANGFKHKNLDVTLFGRKGDGYVRLFTTLSGMKNTELSSDIVTALKRDGKYSGTDVMVGNIKCGQAVYQSKQDGNYILFVGKNCK